MSNKTEYRNYAIRAADGEAFVLAGRAVSYNEISSNELAPGIRERILPNCFADFLATGVDVKALFNHQEMSTLPLGRTANGTLKIADGPEGLDFRIQLDRSNGFHQSVYASVKRSDLSEMSFGFVCLDEDFQNGFTRDGKACTVRNVRKATLTDVSVVTRPFYGDGATNVDARSAGAVVNPVAKWLADQQADWKRQERAHELGLQIIREANPVSEKRGMEDFASMRDKLQEAMPGYCHVGHDDDYAYGVSEDDEDDSSIYRFGYELDKEGHVTLDTASRTKFTSAEVSGAVRSAVYTAFKERDLKVRMRSASGRTTR